jgi:dihydrofolate reductase
MAMSLDGYIVGPDGSFDWTPPDEELFRLATDEVGGVGVHLLGRRLYETMLYWETADQNPSLDFSTLEFAAIWRSLPKVVFSTTLSAVQGNARLASGSLAEEIERLRAESGEGDIAIGGATLAADAAALGLIDEYFAGRLLEEVGIGDAFGAANWQRGLTCRDHRSDATGVITLVLAPQQSPRSDRLARQPASWNPSTSGFANARSVGSSLYQEKAKDFESQLLGE